MTDQSVTERKHDAILDAARTVFSREGYAASSVDDVAAQAGIGKGTVYLYFKSKEELYIAALARDIRVFADKAREEMESVPPSARRSRFSSASAWSIAARMKISCAFTFPKTAACV
jgi:AcrR family transcriptional regulator